MIYDARWPHLDSALPVATVTDMRRTVQVTTPLRDLIGVHTPTTDDVPITSVGVVLDTPEKVSQFLAQLMESPLDDLGTFGVDSKLRS